MEDAELRLKLETLEKKLDATFAAADKTKKWMFWTGVITVALIVLPMIGLVFVIPQFISTYSDISNISM